MTKNRSNPTVIVFIIALKMFSVILLLASSGDQVTVTPWCANSVRVQVQPEGHPVKPTPGALKNRVRRTKGISTHTPPPFSLSQQNTDSRPQKYRAASLFVVEIVQPGCVCVCMCVCARVCGVGGCVIEEETLLPPIDGQTRSLPRVS